MSLYEQLVSDSEWDTLDLDERNKRIATAYDERRDAADFRSPAQRKLDDTYREAGSGYAMMLGQSGDSAADFVPSGFVKQHEINKLADKERDLAVGYNTVSYEAQNADPGVRGNYQSMADAYSDYISGDRTPEDARRMALTLQGESKRIEQYAQRQQSYAQNADAMAVLWNKAEGHSSAATSIISDVTELGQTLIADGLNAATGTDVPYMSENDDYRGQFHDLRRKAIGDMAKNEGVLWSEAEQAVDTQIADASLNRGIFEGPVTTDSRGNIVEKPSMYLQDEYTVREQIESLDVSAHAKREFYKNYEQNADFAMQAYRQAAKELPGGEEYFTELGGGDMDAGIRQFAKGGTASKSFQKFVARVDDWLSGLSAITGDTQAAEKWNKAATARRIFAGEMAGSGFLSDIVSLVPDLAVSFLGGSVVGNLSKAGRALNAGRVTAANVKAARRASVYGSAIAAGGGAGFGVFGEARARGESLGKSAGLSLGTAAISAGVTVIGGASGFENLAVSSVARKTFTQNLLKNKAWQNAMFERWGKMATQARSVYNNSYKEFLEEGTNEWLESTLISSQMHPDLSLNDHAEVAWHAAKLGGVVGGGTAVYTSGRTALDKHRAFKKQKNQRDIDQALADDSVDQNIRDLNESDAPLTAQALTENSVDKAASQIVPGPTMTSERVAPDKPGEEIDENAAVDEFEKPEYIQRTDPVPEQDLDELTRLRKQRQPQQILEEERAAAYDRAVGITPREQEDQQIADEIEQRVADEVAGVFPTDSGWNVDKYETKEEASDAANKAREGLSSLDKTNVGRTATGEKLSDAVRVVEMPDGTYEVHSTSSSSVSGENTRINAIKQAKEQSKTATPVVTESNKQLKKQFKLGRVEKKKPQTPDEVLRVANQYSRVSRQIKPDEDVQGMFNYNPETMQLEVAADESFDGYGERRAGVALPERADIDSSLTQVNERIDLKGKFMNLADIDRKMRDATPEQLPQLESQKLEAQKQLQSAAKEMLSYALTGPAIEKVMGAKLTPEPDSPTVAETLDDETRLEYEDRAGYIDQEAFLNSIGLQPNFGASSRNNAKANALMDLYGDNYSPMAVSALNRFDTRNVPATENVMLDMYAIKENMPGTNFDRYKTPEGKKVIDALVQKGYMEKQGDNFVDTLNTEQELRYEQDFKGRDNVGKSILLLENGINKDGTFTLNMLPKGLRKDSSDTEQQAKKKEELRDQFNRTRQANVTYVIGSRTATRMNRQVDSGEMSAPYRLRVEMQDPAAILYEGTGLKTPFGRKHPLVEQLANKIKGNSIKSSDGRDKAIPIPEWNPDNLNEVETDWLHDLSGLFKTIKSHAESKKIQKVSHPTLIYADTIIEKADALSKRANNMINDAKRLGGDMSFPNEDARKQYRKDYNDLINRVRDLGDIVTEAGKQSIFNKAARQESLIDQRILEDMDEYKGGKLVNVAPSDLLSHLEEYFGNEFFYRESYTKEGQRASGLDNRSDIERNDDMISRMRESGFSADKRNEDNNKRMRSLVLASLFDGNTQNARSFAAQFDNDQELDAAIFSMLGSRVEQEGASTEAKRFINDYLQDDTLQPALGKTTPEAYTALKDYIQLQPAQSVTMLDAKDAFALSDPDDRSTITQPNDYIISRFAEQLADVPVVSYDGRKFGDKSDSAGNLILTDSDGKIAAILMDRARTRTDDLMEDITKQMLNYVMSTAIDEETSIALSEIRQKLATALEGLTSTDSTANMSNAEFVTTVMTNPTLQNAILESDVQVSTPLDVDTDSEADMQAERFLEESYYTTPLDIDSDASRRMFTDTDQRGMDDDMGDDFDSGLVEDEYDDTLAPAFASLDTRGFTDEYKQSDVLRQVSRAAFRTIQRAEKAAKAESVASDYQGMEQRVKRDLQPGDISILAFSNRMRQIEERKQMAEAALDKPFTKYSLKKNGDVKSEAQSITDINAQYDAANGEGDWITAEPMNQIERDFGDEVEDNYRKQVEPQLNKRLVDTANRIGALQQQLEAIKGDTSQQANLQRGYINAALNRALEENEAIESRLAVPDAAKTENKKAALKLYKQRMQSYSRQRTRMRRLRQREVSPLTDFDLKDGEQGVKQLRKMIKEVGITYRPAPKSESEIAYQTDDQIEADIENIVNDTQPSNLLSVPNAPQPQLPVKGVMKPLSAPNALASAMKAGYKLQSYVRNKVYENDELYRTIHDENPMHPVLVNYNGIIASMSQTYADPRSTDSLKQASKAVLEAAIAGDHKTVFNNGHRIIAHTISEDAAITMLDGVYENFKKKPWHHRRSVIDNVLSQDKGANAYGNEIFGRMDLGLWGTDARYGWGREILAEQKKLEDAGNRIGKQAATKAYVMALLPSFAPDSNMTERQQVERNIEQIEAGLANNEAWIGMQNKLKQKGSVAGEIRAQIQPAREALDAARQFLDASKTDENLAQRLEQYMQKLMTKGQRALVEEGRAFFRKHRLGLKMLNNFKGKTMGDYENYLPWRGFDTGSVQGPDTGVDHMDESETLHSNSSYSRERFNINQLRGLDLNPVRAILSVANNVSYQVNTHATREHYAHVFGDENHDSQFANAVSGLSLDAKSTNKLITLNKVLAEEVNTLNNNDLRNVFHDGDFMRLLTTLGVTGYRVSLTSIEQPVLQTAPVIAAYGLRDAKKAAATLKVMGKLMATTPVKAATEIAGNESDTYAAHVDALLQHAAPFVYERQVNGINELKQAFEKVKVGDMDTALDKAVAAPKALYGALDTVYDAMLKLTTAAPDALLIRSIWIANYEAETGKPVDANSIAELDVAAATKATNVAEGEMALSDRSTKAEIMQPRENVAGELFRRAMFVFSNHTLSLAPNVQAGFAMMRSSDPEMKAEGRKRLADYGVQVFAFNMLKLKNVAYIAATLATLGIEDEDKRRAAQEKRQQQILDFYHDKLGYNQRRPQDASDFRWNFLYKSMFEMAGAATPWMAVAQFNGVTNDFGKMLAEAITGDTPPGMGDRYMGDVERFINTIGAPGFAINSAMQFESIHRTATKSYEWDNKHTALMLLTFGGPRELRQRYQDEVRDNTGAPEWKESYGNKVPINFYKYRPQTSVEPVEPEDYNYQPPTADDYQAALVADVSEDYMVTTMDYLKRGDSTYSDGDSGVMGTGFLDKFYWRFDGADTPEKTDHSGIANNQLRQQAAIYGLTKQQTMKHGKDAAYHLHKLLDGKEIYVAHQGKKVHGGRRTYAHILIKHKGNLYNVRDLMVSAGYARVTGINGIKGVNGMSANEDYKRLKALEARAKKLKLGVYSTASKPYKPAIAP